MEDYEDDFQEDGCCWDCGELEHQCSCDECPDCGDSTCSCVMFGEFL